MPSTKSVLTRNEEITRDFQMLVDKHVDDLLHRRIDRRFHAKDFAKLLFIDSRHLTNTIKLTTGRSTCDFMEDRLMMEAKKLLNETSLSISEVGAKFAYSEATNFSKFFKGIEGISPLKYRKMLVTPA